MAMVGSALVRPLQAPMNANRSHSGLGRHDQKVYINQSLIDCQLLIIEMRENASRIAYRRRKIFPISRVAGSETALESAPMRSAGIA